MGGRGSRRAASGADGSGFFNGGRGDRPPQENQLPKLWRSRHVAARREPRPPGQARHQFSGRLSEPIDGKQATSVLQASHNRPLNNVRLARSHPLGRVSLGEVAAPCRPGDSSRCSNPLLHPSAARRARAIERLKRGNMVTRSVSEGRIAHPRPLPRLRFGLRFASPRFISPRVKHEMALLAVPCLLPVTGRPVKIAASSVTGLPLTIIDA